MNLKSAFANFKQTIKIARPGFWPTHIWFYLLPFAGRDVFGSLPFWLGGVYVCFPLGLLVYGWNDYGDLETDRINPRKDSWLFGAILSQPIKLVLPWIILMAQLPFVVLFVWAGGMKMLGWFVALLLVNGTYNMAGFKRLPILDLLNQTGYLLIFVLASWLCSVPQLNPPAMVFSALFAMQSHLFGQLMDLEEDREAGRHSTAILIGSTASKLLLVGMMLIETVIAFVYFHGPFVGVFMFAGACYFLLDACFGPKQYPVWFAKTFFVGWNIVVVATMYFVWRYGVFLVG